MSADPARDIGPVHDASPPFGRRWSLTYLLLMGVVGLGIAGVALYIAMFVWSTYASNAWARRNAGCMQNMKTLSYALRMYAADSSGSLPLRGNWCDDLIAYGATQATFVCPSAPRLECGYAYLAGLAGVRATSVVDAGGTVAIFESDHGWNAAGGAALLPKDPRHLYGDFYAFVDGHVAWQGRTTAAQRMASRRRRHARVPTLRWRPVLTDGGEAQPPPQGDP